MKITISWSNKCSLVEITDLFKKCQENLTGSVNCSFVTDWFAMFCRTFICSYLILVKMVSVNPDPEINHKEMERSWESTSLSLIWVYIFPTWEKNDAFTPPPPPPIGYDSFFFSSFFYQACTNVLMILKIKFYASRFKLYISLMMLLYTWKKNINAVYKINKTPS